MIPSHQFYSAYLSNHFQIKKMQALKILRMSDNELQNHIKDLGLDINGIEYLKTVKIDLLQCFYQSAETLFGLMHSLENRNSNASVPDYLVKAKITDLHNYIRSFRSFSRSYDYLRSGMKDIEGKDIPLHQWLFYPLTLIATNFPDQYTAKVNSDNNIKGIALTLNRISQLFNGEAHNSIKHGLRCILIEKININLEMPEIEGLSLPEEFKSFSGEKDVLMYYTAEKGNDVAIQVLVPLNISEVIYMIDGVHHLQHNLMNDRDILFSDTKPDKVTSYFFSHEEIEKIPFQHNSNFESIRVGPPQ